MRHVKFFILLCTTVLAVPLTSHSTVVRVNESFDGAELSSLWTVIGGNPSNYSVASGKLTIHKVDDGLPHGSWREMAFTTPFDASADFALVMGMSFDRTANAYQIFEFVLLDASNVDVVGFRVWNSPSQWVLSWAGGDHEAGPVDCWIGQNSSYTPKLIEIQRASGVVTVTMDGSLFLTCASLATVASIRMEAMQWSGTTNTSVGITVDYIDALSADTREVYVDIKPGCCPNPLNVTELGATDEVITERPDDVVSNDLLTYRASDGTSRSTAVVSVAVLGAADFDVMSIERTSITLKGVVPIRFGLEDVSQKVSDGAAECACNTLGPDGYEDLTLKFDKAALIASLPSLDDGESIALSLTGNLIDGTPIEGRDCVLIINRGASALASTDQPVAGDPYPNPFNPATSFGIDFPQTADYTVSIHNVLGRVVRTYAGHAQPGRLTITWDGKDQYGHGVGSGFYFYRLRTDNFGTAKMMLLLK